MHAAGIQIFLAADLKLNFFIPGSDLQDFTIFPHILTLRFCFDLGGLAGRGVRPGAGDQPEAVAQDGEAGCQQGRGLPGQARAGDRRSNNNKEQLAPLEQLRRGHAELAARHEQFSAEHVSAVERSRLYDQVIEMKTLENFLHEKAKEMSENVILPLATC